MIFGNDDWNLLLFLNVFVEEVDGMFWKMIFLCMLIVSVYL